MTVSLPEGITLDDIAPEALRERARDLTAALNAAIVQLRPLADLGDELLADFDRHLHAAEERYPDLGSEVVNDLGLLVDQRPLLEALDAIHEITDTEGMYRSWPHREEMRERWLRDAG